MSQSEDPPAATSMEPKSIAMNNTAVKQEVDTGVVEAAASGKSIDDDDESIYVPRPVIKTWKLVVILSCIGISMFLSLMDATIVSTILYSVSEEFGSFRTSSWIVLSYTLTYVGSASFLARLADAVGRKVVLCCSCALFLVASLACGASQTMNQLIGFRAVQGIGGAGMYSMAMVIYPEIAPPELLSVISALMGLVVALAGVSGPIIGGLLTSYRDWRYVFWINGPCALVPLLLLIIVWPKDFHAVATYQFHRVDWLGVVLIMLGSILPVFMLNQAAIRVYTWGSPATVIVFVISALCWIVLITWQWAISRYPKIRYIEPQLPFRLLKNRVMVAGFLTTILTGFIILGTIINIPLRAQIVNVKTAVDSGVILLPMMGGTAVGAGIGGAASAKRNNTPYTLIVSSLLMVTGCALLSTLPGDSFEVAPKQWGYEVILGVGVGLSLSTATFLTSLQVAFRDHALAQGLVAQFRIFGGSFGVAASFIILNNQIEASLTTVLSPDQLADLYASPAAITKFSLLQQIAVRETYINVFNTDMRTCTYIAAAVFVISLFTIQRNPPSVKERLAALEEVYKRSEARDAARDAAAAEGGSATPAPAES